MGTVLLGRGVRMWAAAAVAAAGAGTAAAQQPPNAANPAAVVSTAPEDAVEIYYGATKVSPAPQPPAAEPAIIPVAAIAPAREPERAGESIGDVVHAVRDGSRDVSSAMLGLIHAIDEHDRRAAEPRPILIPSPTPPPAPVAFAPAQQPVVVVRDSPAPPVPESGGGVNVPALAGFAVGLLGLGAALRGRIGGQRKLDLPELPAVPMTPLPPDPNSLRVMGKYNAGPKPETAEKFELGPTYRDELDRKKQSEEAGNEAAVEFILNQNLAMLAAINPEVATTEAAALKVDPEGYALPAVALA